MTLLRVAVGLTILFTVLAVLMLLHVPFTFGVLEIVVLYVYALLPIRWALILALLIRTVRAKPFRLLPRSPLVQIPFVVFVQVALGIMSFAGMFTLSEPAMIGDRVLAFVLHVCVPWTMIAFLARRAGTVVPAAGSQATD